MIRLNILKPNVSLLSIMVLTSLVTACGNAATANQQSGSSSSATGQNATQTKNQASLSGHSGQQGSIRNTTTSSKATTSGNSTDSGNSGAAGAANPTAPVGYEAGVQAFGKRNFQAAIADETKAIAADPTFYPAYNVKGIALCFAGSFTTGMDAIDESLKLHPNYGYGLFNKALGLELYGYYNEAIATYKKAIPLGTGQWWKAWSYYGIASIYGRRGDVPHVVQYLKEAEAISVNTKIAARTEKDFNPVRWSPAFQALLK